MKKTIKLHHKEYKITSGSKWQINVTDEEWQWIAIACARGGMPEAKDALVSVRAAYAETRGFTV